MDPHLCAILLYLVGKEGYVLAPELDGGKHLSSGMSTDEFGSRGVIIRHIGLIEIKKLCKGEHEGLGHLVAALDIFKDRGENSYLELAERVESYRGKIVLNIGVRETLDNAGSLSYKLVTGKVESGNNLIEYALFNMLTHTLVINTALNGIKA